MKLRELLRYIDHNQKIILNHGRWAEEFSGLAREVNLIQFGERELDSIYMDDDIYTHNYLKIRLKKE